MTNDELQMTKEIRSSKVERRAGVRSAVSSFGFRCSFGFRDSSFGFGDCGSWRAPFRFFACIGTMNCPADVAQASSPASAPGVPPGVRAGGETPLQLAAGTAAIRGSWKASTALMPCIGTMNRSGPNVGQASRLPASAPARAGRQVCGRLRFRGRRDACPTASRRGSRA